MRAFPSSGTPADGSITTAKLAPDAVDGTKLADNAVGSEHITALAVTAAKVSADLQDDLLTAVVTVTDAGSNTGTFSLQVKDAAGNNVATCIPMKVWVTDADGGIPDSNHGTVIAATTGTIATGIAGDYLWEMYTDVNGILAGNLAGGGVLFVAVTFGGRVFSDSAEITS